MLTTWLVGFSRVRVRVSFRMTGLKCPYCSTDMGKILVPKATREILVACTVYIHSH